MTFSDIKSSRKAKIITVAVVTVATIAVIALSVVSCSNESAAGAIGAGKAIVTAVKNANDNIEETNHEEAAPEDAAVRTEAQRKFNPAMIKHPLPRPRKPRSRQNQRIAKLKSRLREQAPHRPQTLSRHLSLQRNR